MLRSVKQKLGVKSKAKEGAPGSKSPGVGADGQSLGGTSDKKSKSSDKSGQRQKNPPAYLKVRFDRDVCVYGDALPSPFSPPNNLFAPSMETAPATMTHTRRRRIHMREYALHTDTIHRLVYLPSR